MLFFHWRKSRRQSLASKVIKIKAYGGDIFKTLGITEMNCQSSNRSHKITFHVVDKKVTTLLGLQDTLKLDLIQLSENVHQLTEVKDTPELQEFKDLFDDKVGKVPVTYKMKIKENIFIY